MLNETEKTWLPPSSKLTRTVEKFLPPKLQVLDTVHQRRAYAEAFVQQAYYRAFHAHLRSFYPILLATSGQDDKFTAVAGIRPAGGEKLFSEHYLAQPIEQILQTDRAGIVEFGNLATANPGQARWLIIVMSSFVYAAGFTRVVFTVVPTIYNAFRRMGLPLTRLVDASRDLLPDDESSDWGSYYASGPAVYCGDLLAGQSALKALARQHPLLLKLSQSAMVAGRSFYSNKSLTLT